MNSKAHQEEAIFKTLLIAVIISCLAISCCLTACAGQSTKANSDSSEETTRSRLRSEAAEDNHLSDNPDLSSSASDRQTNSSADSKKVIEPSKERACQILDETGLSVDEYASLGSNNIFVANDSDLDLRVACCDGHGLGVLRDGEIYPLAWKYTGIHFTPSSGYPVDCFPLERAENYDKFVNDYASTPGEYADEYFCEFNRAGEETLVTFVGLQGIKFFPMEGCMYINKKASAPTEDQLFREAFGGAAELEGINIENADAAAIAEILASKGVRAQDVNEFDHEFIETNPYDHYYMLASDEPTELTVGIYQGTKFVESTVSINYYVTVYGDPYEPATTRTKNGYFIVDTSAIPAGNYQISSSNHGVNYGMVRLVDSE